MVWSADHALHLAVSNAKCSRQQVDDTQAVLARSCDRQSLRACTVWLWHYILGPAVALHTRPCCDVLCCAGMSACVFDSKI